MPDTNPLAGLLTRTARTRPEAPFLRAPDGAVILTHGAFLARAEAMAAALLSLGLQPGDRVAVQAAKTPEMVELYLATLLAGGVFLPLNTAYTPAEMAHFLTDAAPRLLVCDPARADALAETARAAGVAQVLTLAADGSGSLRTARDGAAPGLAPVPRGPEDMAAILYTSGTTGRSKGAMLSRRALASNAQALAGLSRFAADDVLLHALPIFHTHGLFVALNVTLAAGASCLWFPAFDAAGVLAAMPRASVMMGVPTFYTRLLDAPGLAQAAAGMRLFVSGSAPLLAETHRHWQAVTGHAILERYGMTETNMNTSNPYEGERCPGTAGFPLPGVELRIADPARGAPLPQGEIGSIELRGPNLFSGYLNLPEKTAEDMRPDGFFITGDLGRVDAEGYLHIVGRSKDLIIAGGDNIYPREIELALDALPGVVESAVVGVPHPDMVEAVVAIVVPDPAAPPTEAGFLAALARQLARFKQPRRILVVQDLPRNAMGKVQKAQLRADHAGLFAKGPQP
jgi:malonyl-CoA/methylmalonyl-CoA synthetase